LPFIDRLVPKGLKSFTSGRFARGELIGVSAGALGFNFGQREAVAI
jgi:hypothetical protein